MHGGVWMAYFFFRHMQQTRQISNINATTMHGIANWANDSCCSKAGVQKATWWAFISTYYSSFIGSFFLKKKGENKRKAHFLRLVDKGRRNPRCMALCRDMQCDSSTFSKAWVAARQVRPWRAGGKQAAC